MRVLAPRTPSGRSPRSACSPWCPGPAAAPPPADRREGRDDGRRDHPGPRLRPVEVRAARRLAGAAAAHIGVLDRVEVDRPPVGVVRPVAGARATGRRHRPPALERAADVPCRPRRRRAVHVDEAQVADPEALVVEHAEDAPQRVRVRAPDHELAGRHSAVEAPVADRQEPQLGERDGTAWPPELSLEAFREPCRERSNGREVRRLGRPSGARGEQADGEPERHESERVHPLSMAEPGSATPTAAAERAASASISSRRGQHPHLRGHGALPGAPDRGPRTLLPTPSSTSSATGTGTPSSARSRRPG